MSSTHLSVVIKTTQGQRQTSNQCEQKMVWEMNVKNHVEESVSVASRRLTKNRKTREERYETVIETSSWLKKRFFDSLLTTDCSPFFFTQKSFVVFLLFSLLRSEDSFC